MHLETVGCRVRFVAPCAPATAESVAGMVVLPGPGTVREIDFAPSDPNVVYAETDGSVIDVGVRLGPTP